jgi:hypothetical protein
MPAKPTLIRCVEAGWKRALRALRHAASQPEPSPEAGNTLDSHRG